MDNEYRRVKATSHTNHGFTLIELLVVMAVVALLLSIAAPRYFTHVERAKEKSLRQSLATMRDALDKYEADIGSPPVSLDDLVNRNYLRKIPEDPYTGSRDTWQTESVLSDTNGIVDVRSGASGETADGTDLRSL